MDDLEIAIRELARRDAPSRIWLQAGIYDEEMSQVVACWTIERPGKGEPNPTFEDSGYYTLYGCRARVSVRGVGAFVGHATIGISEDDVCIEWHIEQGPKWVLGWMDNARRLVLSEDWQTQSDAAVRTALRSLADDLLNDDSDN